MEGDGKEQQVMTEFESRFKTAIQHLISNESPHEPNPPSCRRRAAVAVVLRVRPVFPHQAVYNPDPHASSQDPQKRLEHFFSQEWVRQGDPEVLLIKRAARVGDRWTGHIALPGGKHEEGDVDDAATSIRETREETGLELEAEHIISIGNLPQRIITAAWGKTPLMVLCSYVFLSLRHDLPPLALQPSEVHSAHWVPLQGLLMPSLHREVRCDVSERFTKQRAPYMRLAIRAIAGQLCFKAVKLKPTESLYCSIISDRNSHKSDNPNAFNAAVICMRNAISSPFTKLDPDDQPLILWGLTLGVLADITEKIDRPATSKLWSWPTFSPPDIRFVVWLLNRKYRSRQIRELSTVSDDGDVQIGGIDDTTFNTSVKSRTRGSEAGVAGMSLLSGYTDRLRRACLVALIVRFVLGSTVSAVLIRRYIRPR